MAVRNVHLFFPLYVRGQNQIWALYIIFLDIFLYYAQILSAFGSTVLKLLLTQVILTVGLKQCLFNI